MNIDPSDDPPYQERLEQARRVGMHLKQRAIDYWESLTTALIPFHKNLTRAGEGMRRYITLYLIERGPTAVHSQDR